MQVHAGIERKTQHEREQDGTAKGYVVKQLSGLDAGFLSMETPTTYGHISSLVVYERPDGEFAPYEALKGRIVDRLGLLEPMRRRLVEVPFELDRPWWVEDPAFDIDFHVRHIAVPPPGDDREVADLVARIIARPLDRDRPLWEAYVIEGLADGNWAVLTKVHHATIDGASGAEFITMLLDTADAEPIEAPPVPTPERVPTPAEMMFRTATNNLTQPMRMARAQRRLVLDAFDRLSKQQSGRDWFSSEGRPSLPRNPVAPPTPFNQHIGPHRRFAFASTSLADLKAIKNATGATLNDVVMAVCAGALRRYLIAHDSPVDRPLVAGVPVSIRTGEEEEKWTNRVSMIIGELPVQLETPLERIAAVHESMQQAKEGFDAVPADALQDFTEFSPPAVFSAASRMATQFRVGDFSRQTINLVVSNVPGPREDLFLGEARMAHFYPVSTIAEGQGLNITVQSYKDLVDFGLVSCRDLVPDLWDLMAMIEAEVAELLDATAEIRATNATAAAPATKAAAKKPASRKRPAKRAAAKKPVAKKAAAKNPAAKKGTRKQ